MSPRRLTALFAGIGVLALPLGACQLLVETDGLAGSAQARSDAGGTPSDGPASADGPVLVDGPSAADPCANGPVHCETFDEGDPLQRNSVDKDDTTKVSIDDKVSVSQPRSARFEITPSSANGSPDATLQFTTDKSVSSFVFEGKVLIDREEVGKAGRLLRLAAPPEDVSINPLMLEQSGNIKDGTNAGVLANLGSIPLNRWLAVRVEMRPEKAIVTVEGASPGTAEIARTWAPNKVMVRFGISEADSPTTGWLVHWDNLVVREL